MSKIIECVENLSVANFKVNDSLPFGAKYQSNSYEKLEANQKRHQNQIPPRSTTSVSNQANESLQFAAKYASHSYPNLEANQKQHQTQTQSSTTSVSKVAALKEKLLDYLSNKLKIEQEDINDVIDIFVSEKITVKLLEETATDELKELFSELKIAKGTQMRVVNAINRSKSKA